MEVTTKSAGETVKFAKNFASRFLNRGGIIALSGDLGAGKTTFTQGFAEGLDIKDKIISPTFVLIRQHRISDNQTLYHIDLYRLEEDPDIEMLGIKDLLESKEDIILIEWAEKIRNKLPPETIFINIIKQEGDSRLIEISDTI